MKRTSHYIQSKYFDRNENSHCLISPLETIDRCQLSAASLLIIISSEKKLENKNSHVSFVCVCVFFSNGHPIGIFSSCNSLK